MNDAPHLRTYVPSSLAARRIIAWEKYIPHKPFQKQQDFLGLTCLEALYGGAAGGGKSDTLLMDALQDVCTPDYAGIIFRRTYQDLSKPGALLDRAQQWLTSTDAHWDGIKKQWRFPSGAKLTFGYLDAEKDKYNYQSAEFQYVAFDETTHFPEGWYRYLLSRLRRLTTMDVPIRARGGTNPGGIGHEWVHGRFIDPKTRGENQFIQASLRDNPFIDQEEYRKALSRLDSVTRRQLEFGEWIQDASGLLYSGFDEKRNVIDEWPKDATWTSVIALDFGVVNRNALALHCWRPHDPVTYVRKCYEFDGLDEDCAREVRDLDPTWKPQRIVGDIGGLGKGHAEGMIRRFGIPVTAAQKHDKMGYVRLLNGAHERGTIKYYGPECETLIKQLKTLPRDPITGLEMKGFANHAADANLYAFRESESFAEPPTPAPLPEIGTKEYWQAIEKKMEENADRWVEQQQARGEEGWDLDY